MKVATAISELQERDTPWCRPIFRWAGSKRSLLPILLRSSPSKFERYFEPFVGSACLFFALKPHSAILGDFNADLIQAYRILGRHPRLVARGVEDLPNTSAAYYRLRAACPETLSEISRAVRFTYLNRNCFNGVYRTNKLNRFNVPRGTRAGRALSEAEVVRCSIALRSAKLVVGDFEETLKPTRKGDFIYLDPPYSNNDRTTFGEYGYGAFGDQDIGRLIASLKRLSRLNAKVLFSYTENTEVLSAIKDWSVVRVRVRRQIGGAGNSRLTHEILASNFSDLNSALVDSFKHS